MNPRNQPAPSRAGGSFSRGRNMANATSEMRRSVDQTTEQAKQGLDQFMGSAQEATDSLQRNTRNIGQKVLTFTERNISATLQFGQRLLQAKDMGEIVKLQTEYVNAQFKAFTDQAKELAQVASEATSKVTSEATS